MQSFPLQRVLPIAHGIYPCEAAGWTNSFCNMYSTDAFTHTYIKKSNLYTGMLIVDSSKRENKNWQRRDMSVTSMLHLLLGALELNWARRSKRFVYDRHIRYDQSETDYIGIQLSLQRAEQQLYLISERYKPTAAYITELYRTTLFFET